ncbi:MAG TPA: hypothetical protein VK174_12130 [Chitinophagales bacterium]|nr:hypothetical protein [Chitinophagales bacterium]
MQTVDKKDIKELLAEAKRFCNAIVTYTDILGLSQRDIGTFAVDVELLRYVIDHDDSFTESFISYNAISIQWRLTDLVAACIASKDYNEQIGQDLGIKLPISDTQGLKSMHLKWSTEKTYSANINK